MNLKTHLEARLAQGELETAIATALSELKEDNLLHQQAIQFSARWATLQQELRMGQVPFTERMRYEDDLRGDFIRFVKSLPDDLPLQAAPPTSKETPPADPDAPLVKPKGISEDRFKWHVFVGLTAIKGGLLLFLTFLSGGMPTQDYQTLMGLMLPVLTTAFILMAKHLIDQWQQTPQQNGPRVNRGIQWTTYLVLFAYLLGMLLGLRSYGRSSGDLGQLIDWVNAIEALLGGFLGYVVSTFFKGKKG